MSLGNLYYLFLYQPILNLLVLLYAFLPGHDLIWAVIVLSLLMKVIFFPISLKVVKTQEAMSVIEPKMKEIRKKYKDDPAEQSKKIMALYKEHNISPWSSMVYPLLQLPILIAIFQIFKDVNVLGLSEHLYSFTPVLDPAQITFLGNSDLTQPSIILALLVAVAQYWQQKTAGLPQKTGWQKNMIYFFPILIFFALIRLSAVLGVYWLINALATIGQQYYLKKKRTCSNLPKQKK